MNFALILNLSESQIILGAPYICVKCKIKINQVVVRSLGT